jgi:hypothetical protein
MDEPVRNEGPGPASRRRGMVRVSRPRARRSAWLPALAGIASLVAAGCVNPAFRETTGQFGAVTKAAVSQQNDRLAVIAANEAERIRADLAANRRQLVLDPACGLEIALDEAMPAPECRLLVSGRPSPTPIEQAPRYQNILDLSDALNAYADGLIALAADASEDEAAFAKSLSGLATSLGSLDGAIQKATGATPADRSAKFGAVATLIAQAGNLYFAHQRNKALKRIVLAGDPLVQEAAALLSGVGAGIDLYDRKGLYAKLRSAQRQAQDTAADTSQSVEAVRVAQDDLFTALAAYNSYGADRRRFAEIGVAHAKLAAAARSGASLAEMKAAVEAVVKLASTARTTIETLQGESGSN